MLGNIGAKLFGSNNERTISKLRKNVQKINSLEPAIKALTDEQLKEKTQEFKTRITQGEKLDKLLPEAFAVVREASSRVLGLRHYDVQLIGGMVLHNGKIAEMRTGEGKTLVATLAVYLNALPGEGVHVVTVNDYLAKRDGIELGRLYSFLGLTTGVIVSGMDTKAKKEAYQSDITYGTNNEFGFDYLRTNMALNAENRLQRKLNFAIVDEVDSILIDEARTPLIISGPANIDVDLYVKLNKLVPELTVQKEEDGPGDFSIDEKTKQIGLTEEGHEHAEKLLMDHGLLSESDSIYSPQNIGLFHKLNACLKAHHLFHKNVDYIVKNDEVIIVDEFTGRTMEGRRWSDGLHQAIEVKENVTVKQETQTLASITYQNYFRLYEKLSGMTGTADTEAFEFREIYKLDTVVIPTNRPIKRKDYVDKIYLKQEQKYRAIVEEIRECMARKQPVLIGTASIETSEMLSNRLKKAGIKHEVLNAKNHQREAEIIATAGQLGRVTIATNMAGRGTDIRLGGSVEERLEKLPEYATQAEIDAVKEKWAAEHQAVLDAGGLHVIGAERHESRRIDNQLRGRSGRQGDPGSSRFYVALDDNLVRIFAGDRMVNMMQKWGMDENDPIESKMVSKQIQGAQKKVESYNFDARKGVLEYDDVANEQRKVIYSYRNQIIDADNIRDMLYDMRRSVVSQLVSAYIPLDQGHSAWDIKGLESALVKDFGIKAQIQDDWFKENPALSSDDINNKIVEILDNINKDKRAGFGDDTLDWAEKFVALQVIDEQWKNHLMTMDMMKQAVWLRSRAQKDPKREYQREAFLLFQELLERSQFEIVRLLANIKFQKQDVAAPEGAEQSTDSAHKDASNKPKKG